MRAPGLRRWTALGVAAAVVVVAAVVTTWLLLRDPGPDGDRDAGTDPVEIPSAPPGNPVPWSHFAVTGAHVQVSYDGSACQKSNGAVATEHADRVVVTAYAQVEPGVCILSAVRYDVAVDLDEPLGDRPLYDGACLEQGRATGTALDPACLRTPPA